MPVKVCSPWMDRIDVGPFGCKNQLNLRWDGEDSDEKTIRVTVQPPVAPLEKVIAPAIWIPEDSPDYAQPAMFNGYGNWWVCSDEVCSFI